MRGLAASLILSGFAGVAAAQSASLGPSGFPVNCAIRPLQVVEVSAPAPGVVREVLVRPGQTVAAGDLIAVFDDDLLRAGYEAAAARAEMTSALTAAEGNRDALAQRVERLRRGVSNRVVSGADLEAAELELALAEAAVTRESDALKLARIEAEQAATALSKARIVSPVSGQVGEDLIDPGENAGSRPIAVIYVIRPLRVEAYVPTAILADFLSRPKFEVVINGDTAHPVEVKLDYLAQVADLSSNTQSVYFTLTDDSIIPGYQCLFPPLTSG